MGSNKKSFIFIKKSTNMKNLTIALIVCISIAYTQQGCTAAQKCQTCDLVNSQCSVCPGYSGFKEGPKVLSNGKCVAMTSANKPTINADQVDYYIGQTRTTAGYTSSNYFYCKTGYYAYIDEVDTAKTGCYATSTTTAAPLSSVTGTPTTTNCTYVNAFKTASSSYWRCYECTNGKAPSSSSNVGIDCTGTTSITNCIRGSFSSTTAICTKCSSGYVLSGDMKSCVAETTQVSPILKNCNQLYTTAALCQTCDANSYIGDIHICVKTAFLKVMSTLMITLLTFTH